MATFGNLNNIERNACNHINLILANTSISYQANIQNNKKNFSIEEFFESAKNSFPLKLKNPLSFIKDYLLIFT